MTPPNSIAIGVSIVILLVLSTILIIIVVAFYKRRSAKQKFYTDCSYSTLSRASGPQTRTRSTQENSSELYDQIHLSPSTGQTEYIPKSENADINNPYTTLQNSHPAYSTVGENTTEHSSTLNATIQETSTQQSLQVAQKSIGEQPTYAAIDKSKKKKFKADEKGPTVSPYAGHEVPSASAQEEKEKVTKEDIPSPHTIEQLYTAVNKKEKVCEPNDEEQAPRIPPHTVEELYTAVQKKPKGRSNADHNIPPHTEEKAYVAKEKPLHTTIKDPCTAAMKNPKDGSTENTDTAPPIPPHTVEELYSAVMKTPKRAVEEEEKAPPKPPCTVEKISGHELNQLVGL